MKGRHSGDRHRDVPSNQPNHLTNGTTREETVALALDAEIESVEKKQLKLERRRKERHLKDKRKKQRLRKEIKLLAFKAID